ncbi:bifunctional protein-serine/threonine kinase/phosphatase [Sagittula sp. M10.9X]|uniref:Bifunctional protein-serine/threonine kinase/phosphatase n=2 Tax=Sagittula salina TaxID=2820268 RepID=A0A940S1Q8_9RHOB|nr:bifunctional protein-serine/threonine kinase/phosphatase [Sagittula salina]
MDTLAVSVGQYSSAGCKPENQDFHGVTIPDDGRLALKGVVLAVADGISSSRVSRDAAEISVRAMMTEYYDTPEVWTVRTAAETVLKATNAWLHGQNASVGDVNLGRVCTLSALVLKGRQGHVLHVGDSRVSQLTGASLEPLTEDHRVVLSAQETYLGRAMGAEAGVAIDYRQIRLAVGDVFVLTTDGVHEHVTGRVVAEALRLPGLDAAAEAVAHAALENGSDDNLTVQIVRVEGLPPEGEALETEMARLPVPPLPKAGAVLDGFSILRPLHSTARSHVFLAEGPTGKVALKVPSLEMAQDAAYLRRFALEEWIARRVRSSHVVGAVPAIGRTALYVVTQWVEGVTLRQWMVDHPQPSLDAVRGIVAQIASGLRALHRREMIHQDLRPENVMIDADGTVTIIDLGSCYVAGVEEAAPGTLPHMPGTYQYTAPEYLSGDAGSVRSDQFALGVVAYEMLTGRLPYGAEAGRIASRRDAMRLTYRPARAADNAVPDWMDAALKRALSPDPILRYPALSEFVAELSRPGTAYRADRHVPLAERNPLRFWKGVAGLLAALCMVLISLLIQP